MFKDKVKKIKNVTNIINLHDLNVITNDKNSVYKINKVKWVTRLKRWLYSLNDKISSFEIANSLVTPSYISLETVLSYKSIIPDAVTSYMSITTHPTKTYQNKSWIFYYSTLKKDLYFWFKYENWIFIAETEKALLDYFYLKSRDLKLTIYDYNNIEKGKFSSKWCIASLNWFKEERFENLEILNFQKLIQYSKKFNKKVYYMSLLLKYYFENNEQKFKDFL